MDPFTCLQAEPLLAEYIEDALAPTPSGARRPRIAGERGSGLSASRAALEQHLASCSACQALVEDMRLALAWTRATEEVAVPARLVNRILQQTSPQADAAVPGWRQQLRAWFRPVLEPRFAMGAAMGLISFSLLLNATGADLSRVELADLSPARLYFHIDRQAHLAGSRAVKFYRDLRIVYEIQSQLQVLRQENPAPEERKKEQPQRQLQRTPLNRKWSQQRNVVAAAIPCGEFGPGGE